MAHRTNSVCVEEDEFLNQDLTDMIVVDAWDEKEELSTKQIVGNNQRRFNPNNRSVNQRSSFRNNQTKDGRKSRSYEMRISNNNYNNKFSRGEKWDVLKDRCGENKIVSGKFRTIESALPSGTEMEFDIQAMGNQTVDETNFDLSTHTSSRNNGREYRQSSGRRRSPPRFNNRYDVHPAHPRSIPHNDVNSDWWFEEHNERSREMSPSEHIHRHSLNYLKKLKTIQAKVDDRRHNAPRHFLEELAEILEQEEEKKRISVWETGPTWQAPNPQQQMFMGGSDTQMALSQRSIHPHGINIQNQRFSQATNIGNRTESRQIPSYNVNSQNEMRTPDYSTEFNSRLGSNQSYGMQDQTVTSTFDLGMSSGPRPFQNQLFSPGSGTRIAPGQGTIRSQSVVHENQLITPAKITSGGLPTGVAHNHILTPDRSMGFIPGSRFNQPQAAVPQNITNASAINMRMPSVTNVGMTSNSLSTESLAPSFANVTSQYDESFFIGSNEAVPVSNRHLFPSMPVQDDFKSDTFMKSLTTNTVPLGTDVGVFQNRAPIEDQKEEDKKTVTELSQDTGLSLPDHSSESTKFNGADNAKINTGSRFLSNQPFYLQEIQNPSLNVMQTESNSATEDPLFVDDYLEVSSPESLHAKNIQHLTSKQTAKKSGPIWVVKSRTKLKPELIKNNLNIGKWNAKAADQPIRIQLKNCFLKQKKTTFLSLAPSRSTANVSEQSNKTIPLDEATNNEPEMPYIKENSPLPEEKCVSPPPELVPPPPPLVIPPPELLKPPPPPIISDHFSYKSKNRKRRRKNKN